MVCGLPFRGECAARPALARGAPFDRRAPFDDCRDRFVDVLLFEGLRVAISHSLKRECCELRVPV
jgi:hypothetical protein